MTQARKTLKTKVLMKRKTNQAQQKSRKIPFPKQALYLLGHMTKNIGIPIGADTRLQKGKGGKDIWSIIILIQKGETGILG